MDVRCNRSAIVAPTIMAIIYVQRASSAADNFLFTAYAAMRATAKVSKKRVIENAGEGHINSANSAVTDLVFLIYRNTR